MVVKSHFGKKLRYFCVFAGWAIFNFAQRRKAAENQNAKPLFIIMLHFDPLRLGAIINTFAILLVPLEKQWRNGLEMSIMDRDKSILLSFMNINCCLP